MTILKQSLPTLRALFFFFAISFPVITFHTAAEGSESLPTKTVALLSDGQSEPLKDLTLRFKKAFQILAQGEVTPLFKQTGSRLFRPVAGKKGRKCPAGGPERSSGGSCFYKWPPAGRRSR